MFLHSNGDFTDMINYSSPDGEIILDYQGGPYIITKVLLRGKKRVRVRAGALMIESEGEEMMWSQRHRLEECGATSQGMWAAGHDKEADGAVEPLGGSRAHQHFGVNPLTLTWSFCPAPRTVR